MNTLTPQMQLVIDYVDTTNTVVFLTGKAGTGKTTLLQHIRQHTRKKLAVIAPTGVAAINAGGMTIHSFFQFPFGPLIPGGSSQPERNYNEEKQELLTSLELLIIDEISMVRPDVLDQIDLVLRNVKMNDKPFGGVQLLLIGDLSQLSPIIREEEWAMLGRYYATPYFFSSLAFQKRVTFKLN
jgi:type II secretory pathway predicted ATPase ExeA